MLHNALTNFEIQQYYHNEPRFNGVYLRNNLDEAYMIYLELLVTLNDDTTSNFQNFQISQNQEGC